MQDSIIAGSGNSRYLRTSLPAGTTWDDALAMLRAGTFPIDLAGLNAAGFTQLGTVLNTQTLLANETAESLGLDNTAVPSDAFAALLRMVQAKADPDAIPEAYDEAPEMDGGTASPGTSGEWARGDHVHPHDTSKQDTLTFDAEPTEDSTNPVASGGVFAALQGKQDTLTMYVNERLAAVTGIITGVESSTTATKNYAVGDTMIVGDTMYVATAAIASGGTIVPGTNVQATTVMEQILTRVAVLG